MLAVLTLSLGLVMAVYGQNLIRYGAIQPGCQQTMSETRCTANAIFRRNQAAIAAKKSVPSIGISDYTIKWFANMTQFTVSSDLEPSGGYAPILKDAFFFGTLLTGALLLYAWRSLEKSIGWHFLAAVTGTLITSVFLDNYISYTNLHQIYATQPRYLLPVMPILIVMVIVAVGFLFRKQRYVRVASLAACLLLFTQGGGFLTPILFSKDDSYWQNVTVIRTNHAAKKILRPLVWEN